MLDDKDIFYSREATELLSEKPAPKWFSLLFLVFNLLGARGIYYNLLNLNAGSAILASVLWGITFTILIFHNRFYKKLDQILAK